MMHMCTSQPSEHRDIPCLVCWEAVEEDKITPTIPTEGERLVRI